MKRIPALVLAAALALGVAGCAQGGQAEPTASPAPTVEPAPTPTAEPTPEPLLGDPLTGLGSEDFSGIRPVAVTLRTGEGSAPWRGLAEADVLLAGVSEGYTAMLTALYPGPDSVPAVGPVGPARDLTLQMALPLNAIPVHIDKNIYAANLLNLLALRDVDGYHVGKVAFAHDDARRAAGSREEDCWYTDGALIRAGLAQYGAEAAGPTQPLFAFGARPAPAAQNAVDLTVTFSGTDAHRLVYDTASGTYVFCAADGTPRADDGGAVPTFANVFVLYAASGIKDDTYTREYDLSGGAGLYLTGGAWEPIRWTKGDATAPLTLADAQGETLTVAPGKSYIAVWGGYYGQKLALLAADGSEQALPEKPALLESGIPDEAAAAAEEAYRKEHDVLDAWAALDAANAELADAQQLWQQAQSAGNATDSDNAAYLMALAQQHVDEARAALQGLGLDPDAGRDQQPAA